MRNGCLDDLFLAALSRLEYHIALERLRENLVKIPLLSGDAGANPAA